MKRPLSALASVLLFLCVSPLEGDDVPVHARVRIKTHSQGTAVGTLLRTDATGLTLASNGAGNKTYALDDVVSLEVSRARRSQKTKWALLGAIPWVVVVTAVLADGGADESGIVSPRSALLLGGGVGAGLIVGSRRKQDVWEPAPIPGATSSFSSREITVGIRLSF